MAARDRFSVELESKDFSCDGLDVVAFTLREAVGVPYTLELTVVSPLGALPDELQCGAEAVLVWQRDGSEARRVHGVVTGVRRRLDSAEARPLASVTVRPRAHRLALVRTQQIFMDASVLDIFMQKASLVGLSDKDVVVRCLASYPKREFVVQYQETDLAFLSRLVEHAGVSLFFEQGHDHDELVLTDYNDGFPVLAGQEELAVSPRLGEEREAVTRLVREELMVPHVYIVQDYNYRTPDIELQASAPIAGGLVGGLVEYGPHIKHADEGDALAQVRADEVACRATTYRGESSACRLSAGFRTRLVPEDGSSVHVLLTAVEHRATLPRAGDGPSRYENSWSAVSTAVPFRPERRTPKPTVPGIVTGVVEVGQGASRNGTAVLDEEGRYTVQFHFDPGMGSERSRASRPLRMLQPFGGIGHGMHFPLRPGTEVAVAFANGDPDRPILVGALPNTHAPSPVTGRNATHNRITTASGAAIEISEKR